MPARRDRRAAHPGIADTRRRDGLYEATKPLTLPAMPRTRHARACPGHLGMSAHFRSRHATRGTRAEAAGTSPGAGTDCGRVCWRLRLARPVRATGAPTGKDKPVVGPRFFTTKNTKNHQGCTKVANRPALSNRVIGLAIDVHHWAQPGENRLPGSHVHGSGGRWHPLPRSGHGPRP